MSQAREGSGQRAHAQVHACIDIRGDSAEAAAGVAAEMIGRLQELANRSDCQCDLDVSVGWQSKDALSAPPR